MNVVCKNLLQYPSLVNRDDGTFRPNRSSRAAAKADRALTDYRFVPKMYLG